MVRATGGEPLDLGIARDEVEEIRSRLLHGVKGSEMILVSGGTSVGTRDLVIDSINDLGKPGIIVHGLCMKPGKPTALAAIDGKPIILLPGFPVAAMVSFYAIVQPILVKLLGSSVTQFQPQMVQAIMSRRVASSLGSKTFVRVLVQRRNEKYVAEPIRTSGAGILSSMIKANGIVIIPEEKEGLEEGEEVEVTLLRALGEY